MRIVASKLCVIILFFVDRIELVRGKEVLRKQLYTLFIFVYNFYYFNILIFLLLFIIVYNI